MLAIQHLLTSDVIAVCRIVWADVVHGRVREHRVRRCMVGLDGRLQLQAQLAYSIDQFCFRFSEITVVDDDDDDDEEEDDDDDDDDESSACVHEHKRV